MAEKPATQVQRTSDEVRKLVAQLRRSSANVLPPELELARRFNVGRNTVRRAIGELEQEGLLERIRGKGTFIRDEAHALTFSNWVTAELAADRYMDKAVEEFRRQRGELLLHGVVVPYRRYLQRLFSLMLHGLSPDVVQITPFWLRRLHRFDLFLPLSDRVSQDIVKRRYPAAFQLGVIGGELHALNWALCPLVLYYNKEVLERAGLDPERPPGSMEELAEMSVRVSEALRPDVQGICLPMDLYEIDFMVMYPFFLAFGGGFVDSMGNIVIDSESNVRALGWLQRLYRRAGVRQEKSIDGTRLLFAAGRLAFMIDGPYGRGHLRQLSGQGRDFDARYGVAALPPGPSGRSESVLLSHALAISRQARNPELAYRWIEFLCTDERTAGLYFEQFGMIPANRDVLHKPSFFSDPFGSVLIHETETATVGPIEHPLFFRILPFLQQGIARVMLHDQEPAESLAFVRSIVPMLSQADSLSFL